MHNNNCIIELLHSILLIHTYRQLSAQFMSVALRKFGENFGLLCDDKQKAKKRVKVKFREVMLKYGLCYECVLSKVCVALCGCNLGEHFTSNKSSLMFVNMIMLWQIRCA